MGDEMAIAVWDGRSSTRPDPSVYRAPDAADWQQVVEEVQKTQQGAANDFFNAIAGRSIPIGSLLKIRPTDGKLVFADAGIDGMIAGMALNAGSPGQDIVYTQVGRIERSDWRPITGTIKLIVGSQYYLAGSGGMSLSPASSGFIVKVGQAITAELFALRIHDSIRL
jgi:hypothetical protein